VASNPASLFKTVNCTCDVCVAMCEEKPCHGTPEEMQRLIDAGHSDRLALYFCQNYSLKPKLEYVEYLGPSPVFEQRGCTFLKDKRCELHASGMKPLEGRVVWHGKTNMRRFPVPRGYTLREYIASLWANEPAQMLVDSWKRSHLTSNEYEAVKAGMLRRALAFPKSAACYR
jgi:hypothetical protein